MEIKKLNIKKGATIKDTIIVLVLFIGAFALFYNFVADNAVNSGVTIDSRYNDTVNNLNARQGNITNLIVDLQDASANLTEAKIGDFAFFGLRGVLTVMQLPLVLPGVASDAWNMISILIPMPDAVKFMVLTIFMTIIMFAIIKFITSRATEA